MQDIQIEKQTNAEAFYLRQNNLIDDRIDKLNSLIEQIKSEQQTIERFIERNDANKILGQDYADEWARGNPYFKQHTLKNVAANLKKVASSLDDNVKRLRYHL